jgi:hypothetical protein
MPAILNTENTKEHIQNRRNPFTAQADIELSLVSLWPSVNVDVEIQDRECFVRIQKHSG